jgi:glutamate-1-semialdehyde 2,1-aminomutase
VFGKAGVPVTINRAESLFSLFFGEQAVTSYAQARTADHARYARFFHAMLDEGIYLPPSGYEAWFLSAAHARDDIDRTLEAAERAARAIG